MDKLNYRVGATPIRHNGRFFGVGEPVPLTEEEAKALQDHVSLDPVQPLATTPAAQAPTVEPAPETVVPESTPVTTADGPKADAKGKKAKPGEKA